MMHHAHDRDLAAGTAPGAECLLQRLGNGVRETLHNVLGLLELAMQEPLSPGQPRHLSQCRAVADRLLRASNDVAELASPYEMPLNEAAFSVRGMVEELAQFAQPLATRRGISFHQNIARDVPTLAVADRAVIQDMVHRLLENSLRVTEEGYLQLSVKAVSEGGQGFLVFEIADTGPGFPPGFQPDASPCKDTSRGLGLPIVRRRVVSMGGTLRILTTTSEGAVVQLAMPVKTARADRYQQTPSATPPMRVLVVEDCDDSYELFEAYVAGHGHSISRVSDGSQALDSRMREDFDVIFMDVNMPVMDGYTATRAIRDWETAHARTHIPIVLLSADDRSRQKSLGAAAGCSGYLTKPTPQADLLAALHYYGKPLALCD